MAAMGGGSGCSVWRRCSGTLLRFGYKWVNMYRWLFLRQWLIALQGRNMAGCDVYNDDEIMFIMLLLFFVFITMFITMTIFIMVTKIWLAQKKGDKTPWGLRTPSPPWHPRRERGGYQQSPVRGSEISTRQSAKGCETSRFWCFVCIFNG